MCDLYFYKASKWLIQDLVKEWSEIRDARCEMRGARCEIREV